MQRPTGQQPTGDRMDIVKIKSMKFALDSGVSHADFTELFTVWVNTFQSVGTNPTLDELDEFKQCIRYHRNAQKGQQP